MRIFLLLLACSICVACGTNAIADDGPIEFQSEIDAYSTEAANIRSDMIVDRTAIAATVSVEISQSDDLERYNTMLRQTVVAIYPPTTEARIVANDVDGPLPVEVYDLSDGEMRFVQIGPAGEINDSGCFRSKQQFFRRSNGVIYMTAVALNLQSGTTIRADWQYGGDLVYSNSTSASQFEQYRCIALAMRSSDVEFIPGNWSVTLSINGVPTEPRSFTILDG